MAETYEAASGITGIDTRTLVKHIRTQGALKGILSTVDLDDESLVAKAKASPERQSSFRRVIMVGSSTQRSRWVELLFHQMVRIAIVVNKVQLLPGRMSSSGRLST